MDFFNKVKWNILIKRNILPSTRSVQVELKSLQSQLQNTQHSNKKAITKKQYSNP